MYRAIIYDIDGTLLNTLEMNMMTLKQIVYEELNLDISYKDICKYAPYSGKDALAELGIKNIDEVYDRWVEYVNNYPLGAKEFDGTYLVLKTFFEKGICQAVVSSKTKLQYKIDFEDKGLGKFIDCTVLKEDTESSKPNPEPLLKCADKLNLKPSECIYIGDAKSDYDACIAANMDFGYAKWGSVSNEGIDNPKYEFESIKDLLNIVDLFYTK